MTHTCWRQIGLAIGEMWALFPSTREEIAGHIIAPVLVGDEAYPLLQWLVAPYLQPVTPKELRFSKQLLALWGTVEQASRQLRGW